jgi:hypothetical protein
VQGAGAPSVELPAGRRVPVLGTAALAISVLHDGYHLARGEAHDLLWFCNLACPLLAVGCFASSARACCVALLWLVFGTPLWALDVTTGGEIIVTSFLTHLGGLLVAVLAARQLGWAARSWLWASGGVALVMLMTRLFTLPVHNVNLAFSVWPGWEKYFPDHTLYLVLLLSGAAVTFLLVERVMMRWIPSRGEAA